MTLLSVGPESAGDDERVIAKGYTNYSPHIVVLILLASVYYFGSTKELIARIRRGGVYRIVHRGPLT